MVLRRRRRLKPKIIQEKQRYRLSEKIRDWYKRRALPRAYGDVRGIKWLAMRRKQYMMLENMLKRSLRDGIERAAFLETKKMKNGVKVVGIHMIPEEEIREYGSPGEIDTFIRPSVTKWYENMLKGVKKRGNRIGFVAHSHGSLKLTSKEEHERKMFLRRAERKIRKKWVQDERGIWKRTMPEPRKIGTLVLEKVRGKTQPLVFVFSKEKNKEGRPKVLRPRLIID